MKQTRAMNFDEIVIRYNLGERNFACIDCWGDCVDGNLAGIDLNCAKMTAVRLSGSNLQGAILCDASITRSSLIGINLAGADLSRANFCVEPEYPNHLMESSLKYANLTGANLTGANLQSVSLGGSNLKNANLQGANLIGTDLRGADLTGANLTDANLSMASFYQANLKDAVLGNNITFQDAYLGWTILPDGSIFHNPAIDLIANKLQHLKRKAWKPITVRGDGSLTASKFAGKPWLSADEQYPSCSCCHTPLQFFLQLNLNELPEGVGGEFGNGILQFFYCTNNEDNIDECDNYEPFTGNKLVRIIQPLGNSSDRELPINNRWKSNIRLFKGAFSPRQIIDWKEMDDYPNWYEAESLRGISCDRDETEIILDCAGVDEEELDFSHLLEYQNETEFEDSIERLDPNDDDFEYYNYRVDIKHEERIMRSEIITEFMENTNMLPFRGDKLAGYPNWVQDIEYPNCPICDRVMDRLIFEFDSDDNVPYLWGDVGTGYIVQCPEHKERVTFFWQCG
jgi:uncharacterized protein YjbI with pentapeptide repeats/uncharacterized protein YwqG